jgi:hypothetical protein
MTEYCDCGGTLIFNDDEGIATCTNCTSHEAYSYRPKVTEPPCAICGGTLSVPMTTAEYALEHAVSWWETVQTMVIASEGRGITFAEGYEPTWLKEARSALESARATADSASG